MGEVVDAILLVQTGGVWKNLEKPSVYPSLSKDSSKRRCIVGRGGSDSRRPLHTAT